MAAVTVVVHVPPGIIELVGEQRVASVADAHPHARVVHAQTPERFLELAPEADALLFIGGDLSRAVSARLAELPRLRWVHSLAAGVNGFLTPELIAAEQVTITSGKGPFGPAMAEHAVAMLMALARGLPAYGRDQAEHRWRPFGDEAADPVLLDGRTALVLGLGSVGARVARILGPGLGMRVLGMARGSRDCPYVDRYVERADLHAALTEADAVVLALPLTPETDRIIDAAALSAMQPTAYLVNVARGALVDQDALVEALRAGRIAGAGLDAFAPEPLPPEHPLWGLPHVVITPHRSAGSDRSADGQAALWRENVRRFAEGEPLLGLVDRQAGY